MKNVRRLGEFNARLLALEERVAAHDVELAALRPPGVEFVMAAGLEIGISIEHNPAITFDAEARMEVWI